MAKRSILGISLTENERADLDRYAKTCGMTTAAWAKASLLRDSNVPAQTEPRRTAPAGTVKSSHKPGCSCLMCKPLKPPPDAEWKAKHR